MLGAGYQLQATTDAPPLTINSSFQMLEIGYAIRSLRRLQKGSWKSVKEIFLLILYIVYFYMVRKIFGELQ